MARPTPNFAWSTDANYATGPDVGTPTKVAPSAGEISSGFVRGTAAIAQHVNWLFGSKVQPWLTYLSGLSTDTQFLTELENRSWHITGTLTADVQVIAAGLISSAGAVVTGQLTINTGDIVAHDNVIVDDNVTVGGTLTVAGVSTFNGDVVLGSGDNITMASRSIVKRIANKFSTAVIGATGLATSFEDELGLSAWFDADSSWRPPIMEFEIPIGATLTAVTVGYTSGTSGGGSTITLYRTGGGTGTNPKATTSLGTHVTASGSSTSGSAFTGLVESAMTGVGGYTVKFEPQGANFAARDRLNWVEITYTTVHVDPND